jgi:hypothetical protein
VEDSGGLEDQSFELWDERVNDATKSIEEVQRGFCRERDIEYVPAPGDLKLGFALATLGQLPINGLRHRPSDGTSGWYIWCGESFRGADDFFDALHLKHLYADYPVLAEVLGLPPGYRFLLAGDYLDIWFDAQLLES